MALYEALLIINFNKFFVPQVVHHQSSTYHQRKLAPSADDIINLYYQLHDLSMHFSLIIKLMLLTFSLEILKMPIFFISLILNCDDPQLGKKVPVQKLIFRGEFWSDLNAFFKGKIIKFCIKLSIWFIRKQIIILTIYEQKKFLNWIAESYLIIFWSATDFCDGIVFLVSCINEPKIPFFPWNQLLIAHEYLLIITFGHLTINDNSFTNFFLRINQQCLSKDCLVPIITFGPSREVDCFQNQNMKFSYLQFIMLKEFSIHQKYQTQTKLSAQTSFIFRRYSYLLCSKDF